MPKPARRLFALSLAIVTSAVAVFLISPDAEARKRRSHSHGGSARQSHSAGSAKHARHHGRHHAAAAPKTRYAYPLDFFMMSPPEFDRSALPAEVAQRARLSFDNGTADRFSPAQLVRAGVFRYHPIRGGIFKRREEVKYIVVHSTESGVPQDAVHVIEAWSSMGRRHPGAQFCVDRDGTIWQACDPDLATVHVNIFKTLPGINNDNTIGIEMCHAGAQTYLPEQKQSVIRLVSYLQDRYHVLHENIITHRYAQQGDHTDPVNFDWEGFLAHEGAFHNKALAMKRDLGPLTDEELAEGPEMPTASVYLEMHKTLKAEDVLARPTPSAAQMYKAEQSLKPVTTTLRPDSSREDAPKTKNFLDTDFGAPASSATTLKRPAIRGEIEVPPDHATGAGSN